MQQQHVCPRCGRPLACLAGSSAHPHNWYCTDESGCGWTAWEGRRLKTPLYDPLGDEIIIPKRFFSALENEPILFFTLQILWLRSAFRHRLGIELSGNYGDGEVSSVSQAAVNLYRIARLQYLQVIPDGQRTLPLIEGLIKFKEADYSFLPNRQPAVFAEDGKVITFASLIKQGRSPRQSVDFLIRRLRGVE